MSDVFSNSFFDYAAKAVAAVVVPLVMVPVTAIIAWAVAHGLDVDLDINAIQTGVTTVVVSALSGVAVFLKRNKIKVPLPVDAAVVVVPEHQGE